MRNKDHRYPHFSSRAITVLKNRPSTTYLLQRLLLLAVFPIHSDAYYRHVMIRASQRMQRDSISKPVGLEINKKKEKKQ
jgi:hypothetical protein